MLISSIPNSYILGESLLLLAGHRAVSVLVMEGRGLADTLEGPEKHQLLSTCDNVERLTKELAELKARGMVRSVSHLFCIRVSSLYPNRHFSYSTKRASFQLYFYRFLHSRLDREACELLSLLCTLKNSRYKDS